MIRIGKSSLLGINWELRDDGGVCKICEGTQIQVNYPVMIGKRFSGREYDLLCIDCGTSVNEERNGAVKYDKKELLFETMEIVIPGTRNYRYASK